MSSVSRILVARDLFARLGLPKEVTDPARIRQEYKRIALEVHPDKCALAEATKAFQLLSEAFDVLYDRESQKDYLNGLGAAPVVRKNKKRKQWWDQRSWAEIERELRKKEEEEIKLRKAFIQNRSTQFQDRKLLNVLQKALSVCRILDERNQVADNMLWKGIISDSSSIEEKSALVGIEDPKQRLEDCIGYLRQNYFHCVFCGTSYNDEKDLNKNCPGAFEADH
jgi:curved DNA-binding protein CbpA